MHLTDNIWVAGTEFLVLFGLIILILVKLASTINK